MIKLLHRYPNKWSVKTFIVIESFIQKICLKNADLYSNETSEVFESLNL